MPASIKGDLSARIWTKRKENLYSLRNTGFLIYTENCTSQRFPAC